MAQIRAEKAAEQHVARLEDARLRVRQSRSATSNMLRSQQREHTRLQMAERRQEKAYQPYNRLSFRNNPGNLIPFKCFQMTSLGAEVITTHFMPTFKVKGQIYHKVGSLLPFSNDQHKFLQTYFIGDDKDDINARCGISTGIKRSIVSQLQEHFHEKNHLVSLFKAAIDMMPSDTHKIVIHADRTPAKEHVLRFNASTVDEVAIIIIGDQF
ncbi:uncharacterized protein NPIL_15091 [Nephila pilipes]|uniref:Uncharacterized protein n=1 Tax=Nephila pilipes TaxID=299642 RepID=A0A8X6NTU7_NEPPI|nr:uncharacterized protein NPIL_15091 [Nephila pilipes]